MQTTDNFRKHTTTSRPQRFLMERFSKKLLLLAKDLHPNSVLDVGAGEGFTLAKFEKENIGKKLEGIEYLPLAISLGKKENPSIKLVQGTIYDLPYKASSFDVVLCTEVLEHIDDPEKGLKELARVTNKYCLISVPNEPFFMLANLLRGKNISRFGNDIEHINHWTTQQFVTFIGKHLKVLAVHTPFPWTLVLAEKR